MKIHRKKNICFVPLLTLDNYSFFALFLSIIFFLASSPSHNAQDSHYKFEHITPDMGLSNGIVYQALQDHEGFIWFTTQDGGLNRYDGYDFVVFSYDPENPTSISNNNPGAIIEDHSGTLWIGTWGGGLNRFVRGKNEFIHYTRNDDDPNSLNDYRVQSLYEDSDSVLWIGTVEGGLNRFNKERTKFTHYKHDPDNSNSISHNRIWGMIEDEDKNLWVGTSTGLDMLDPSREKITHFKHNPADENSISHSQARCLYIDNEGTILVGTPRGVNIYHAKEKRFTHYLPYPKGDLRNNVNAIFQDSNGTIWVGTEGGGACIFYPETGTFAKFTHDPWNEKSLSDDDIRHIFEDNSGVLWLTTRGAGVNKMNLNPAKFNTFTHQFYNPNSLNKNRVRAIYKENNDLVWIGTQASLEIYNKKTGKFKNLSSQLFSADNSRFNSVRALLRDNDGNMWIGTRRGLYMTRLVKSDLKVIKHFSNKENDPESLSHDVVWSIYEDSKGSLWIGTYSGLSRLKENGRFKNYHYRPESTSGLNFGYVTCLIEGHKGEMWIGTDTGLNRFNPATEKFDKFIFDLEDTESISDNRIYCFCKTRNIQENTLWIGTQRGLNKLIISEAGQVKFKVYTTEEGLPNNVIQSILEGEDGNLWISTNKGISRFDPVNEQFKNFTASDGLQGNEFILGSGFASSDGELFFGGTNGFNSFYPGQLQINKHIPQIVITSFKVSDKELLHDLMPDQLKEVNLSYDQNFLSFEFAALDFVYPEENKYAYMLEGRDDDWIYSGSRRYASYSGLEPGHYVFKVKGSNNDDVWNNYGTSLHVLITPPFWKTWWFISLIAFVIAAAVVTIARRRTMYFEEQKALLEKQVELSSRSDRLKTEFLAQMSHEIRTPINSILSFVSLVKERIKSYNDEEEFEELLVPIDSAGRRVVRTIDLILNMSEIQTGTYEPNKNYFDMHSDILSNLVKEFKTSAASQELELFYNNETDKSVLYIDDYSVKQIFTNLIDNAIKYTNEGSVSVRLYRNDASNICVDIKDTGIGISSEFIPLLFDAFTQEEAGYTRQFEGNGLGLALVKTYCEINNARIEVSSIKNEGTTMTVLFNPVTPTE